RYLTLNPLLILDAAVDADKAEPLPGNRRPQPNPVFVTERVILESPAKVGDQAPGFTGARWADEDRVNILFWGMIVHAGFPVPHQGVVAADLVQRRRQPGFQRFRGDPLPTHGSPPDLPRPS